MREWIILLRTFLMSIKKCIQIIYMYIIYALQNYFMNFVKNAIYNDICNM